MKALKIISIISFLMIFSMNPKGFPVFIILLICLVDFVQSFTYNNLGISWETGTLAILTIGSLIAFLKCRKYKDRYSFIFCFIALLIAALFLSEAFNQNNYERISFGFVIPLAIFIISSLILIIKNFKTIK